MLTGFNVAADSFSVLICIVLAFFLLSGSMRELKSNRYIAVTCIAGAVMQMGDLTNWLCEGTEIWWFSPALQVGCFLFYISPIFMLYGYMGYLLDYISSRTRVHAGFKWVLWICSVSYLIICLITPFTGFIYFIDSGNIYHRGDGFFVSQIFPFGVYLLAIVLVVCYRKYLKKLEIIVFLSYVFLPLAANLVQAFHYGIALLGMACTLAVLCVFVNLQIQREVRMKEQQAELADARIAVMTSQINPHFIYNALAVIRQLCEENPPLAKQAVTDFSQYLRMNMDFLTNRKMIEFQKELEHTKNYLSLEKLRFGEKLSIAYDINVTSFQVPPLTLQPIVENAVRHGILRREEGGSLLIRTVETAEEYRMVVCDNGVGFEAPSREDGRAHIGIANVKQRLAALCGGRLEIESIRGQGTTVTIMIPKEGSINEVSGS